VSAFALCARLVHVRAASDMLQASTPFAIRDENDVKTGARTGKRGGLGGIGHGGGGLLDSTPLKATTLTSTTNAKSTRKALGDLSSSQVNTRLATPGHNLGGKLHLKEAPTVFVLGTSSSIKPQKPNSAILPIAETAKAAATSTTAAAAATADVEDMLCSHVHTDEDAYDYVMRKAAKIKFTLSPPACDTLREAHIDDEWHVPGLPAESDWCGGEADELQPPELDCELPDDSI